MKSATNRRGSTGTPPLVEELRGQLGEIDFPAMPMANGDEFAVVRVYLITNNARRLDKPRRRTDGSKLASVLDTDVA